MYLFSFNKFTGHDRVFLLDEKIKSDSGDLIKIQDDYFFCLGENISFQELYTYKLKMVFEPTMMCKGLLSNKAMEFLHWMVYERYSTYKSVLKLFLSFEIDKLLEKGTSKKNAKNKQELTIFPDLWTLYNTVYETTLEDKKTGVLSSIQTQNQKDKLFWKIKKGEITNIIGTSSEIFQDYSNLQKITFISPDKRYYSSQKDPRYKTSMVVDKLKEIYGCEVEVIE